MKFTSGMMVCLSVSVAAGFTQRSNAGGCLVNDLSDLLFCCNSGPMKICPQYFTIAPLLREFINDIFLIETTDGFSNSGMDIIEPNGTMKLIISLEGPIEGRHSGRRLISAKDQITYVSMFDSPFEIQTSYHTLTRLIVVQFSPVGSYRLLRMNYENSLNTLYSLDDIYHDKIKRLQEMISDEADVNLKVKKLQHYLQHMLYGSNEDKVFNYCIRKIAITSGCISVKELVRDTGYSDRWLNKKFKQYLGLSPKIYSSIIRFNTVFQSLASNPELYHKDKIYLDFYYDQPHFVRDFKRYSGQAPTAFYEKYKSKYIAT